MAKNIVMRKGVDKIKITDGNNCLICDIIIANCSRTSSVNLSIQADQKYRIRKTTR